MEPFEDGFPPPPAGARDLLQAKKKIPGNRTKKITEYCFMARLDYAVSYFNKGITEFKPCIGFHM
jgi:hypothetical protein